MKIRVYTLYIDGEYVDSCRAMSEEDAEGLFLDDWDLSGDDWEIDGDEY